MKNKAFNNALRIAVYYLIIGAIWILFSDRLLDLLSSDHAVITNLQTLKGWGFVAITCLLLFLFLNNFFLNLEKEKSNLISAQSNLNFTEQMYELLFENSGEAILLTHPDGSIFKANPEACRIFGRTEDEICDIGRNGIVNINDPRLIPIIGEREKTGKLYGELNLVRKDGTIFPGEISTTIFYDTEGKKKTSILVRDITIRKQTEIELNITNEELQTLNNVILKTIELVELKDRLEYILDEALKVVGLEGGTVCLINPNDTFDLVVHRETTIETIDDLSKHKIKIGDCLCGNCAKDCKPLILKDREEVLDFATREVLRGEDIRFHAAFPFIINRRCVGVLCVFTKTDNKPTQRSLKLLETIVAQTSVSIDNARLYKNLKETEERYRVSFEKARDGITVFSEDQKFLSVNEEIIRLSGYSKEEILSLNLSDIFLEASSPESKERIVRMQKGEMIPPFEAQLLTTSGNTIPVEISVTSMRNLYGFDIVFQGVVRDITERKKTEEELRKHEQQLSSIYNAVGDIIFYLAVEPGEQFRFVSVSPSGLKVTGVPAEMIVGRTVNEVIPEPSLSIVLAKYRESITTGTIVYWEETTNYPAGKLTGEVSISPVYDSEGNCTHLVGSIHNITDRKQAEEALRESEAYNRMLFDQSIIGFAVTTMEGKLVDINPAYSKIIGRTIEETLKLTYWDITPREYAEQEKMQLESLNSIGHYGPYEKEYIHKDGHLVSVQLQGSLIETKGEKYIWSSVEDITERKRFELLRTSETYLLELITKNTPLPKILEEIVLTIEALSERTIASILLLDDEGIHIHYGAAPHLPEGYNNALEGAAIGPSAGSCGTAAYRKEAVIVTDIEVDSLWDDYRELARAYNLRACWSTPIINSEGKVLGTFAMYYREPRNPEEEDFKLIESATHLAEIAIERKRVEKKLIESEARNRNVFEQANDGIYIISAENRYLDANECGFELLGYKRDELLKLSVADVLDPDEVARLAVEPPRMMSGIPYLAEWKHVRKDGSTFPGEVSARRLDDHSYLAIVRNLTERRHTEMLLRQSEERLRLSTELANVAVWEYDFVKNTMLRSKNHDKLYGLELQENWEFETFLKATHPDDQEYSNSTIKKSAAAGGPDNYQFDFRVIYPDKSVHWLGVTGQIANRDAEGVAKIARGTLIDITDRKLIQEELRLHKERLEELVQQRTAQLEAANKELEAFSYSVSHDLRAPLRHVSGYVELLGKHFQTDLSEKGRHYLEVIVDSVRQMGTLIDELLQFSRTGRIEMHRSDENMNVIVQESVQYLQQESSKRKIDWIIGTMPSVFCDSAMIKLVWMNLLSNAVKFTCTRDSAKIEIGVQEEIKELVFFVRDNGVGFDMQYAQKLFGVFQRLHSMEEFEGTGIGLANVRRIISRHGGRTWAEAETDKGATFYFTLPKHKEEKS